MTNQKLIYLSCDTRLDITIVVIQLNECKADLKVDHLKVIKHVVQYLKSMIYLRLIYGTNNVQSIYGLIRYANSNYAGNLEGQKFVMGHFFFIHKAVVSWCSKKQHIVSTFTIKVKYIALGHTARENI